MTKRAKTPKVTPCKHPKCKAKPSASGYCRLHYIVNSKKIKEAKSQQAEQRLDKFISKIAGKYPESALEKLKEGLETEEGFQALTQELDLDPDAASETEQEFLEKFTKKVKPE